MQDISPKSIVFAQTNRLVWVTNIQVKQFPFPFLQRDFNVSLPKKTMENGTLHMTVMVTKVGESPWSGKGMSLKETSVTKYAPPREEEINLLRMTNEVGLLAERYI